MSGLGGDDALREAGIIGRHVAPAEQLQPFGIDDARYHGLAIDALRVVPRHEHVTDRVVPGFGQLDLEACRGLFQEGVRDLHEDAGAVAGERVGAGRTTMGQVLEDLDAVLDDGMARPALQIHHKADATRIVLALRIVESLRLRRGGPCRTL